MSGQGVITRLGIDFENRRGKFFGAIQQMIAIARALEISSANVLTWTNHFQLANMKPTCIRCDAKVKARGSALSLSPLLDQLYRFLTASGAAHGSWWAPTFALYRTSR